MNNTPSNEPRNCPECGNDLPVGVPKEFCPKCLLGAALTPSQAGTTRVPEAKPPPIPAIEGQVLGHYLIHRPLGSGGMGAVFEAEDLESNRRVALKVLSHRLDSPEARERFLREGRLAASVNHPNSVYIFGTEEIGGTPVISMELLNGGTLQDRVRERGPMRPNEAVDAVLQIIAGLEAAQAAGILHRDIKPSNCFIDQDGTVKIGDFGLSISTAVRIEPALTADGSFLGTPAFCPPEQLRGEELNARSDIYAVGATLYYLLTGKTPFEAHNVVALIATVLEKPAPSPRDVRSEIPYGLVRAVQRCLQKDRGERYGSYAELRRALEPFSSAVQTPAPLGTRFLAGALDLLLLSVVLQGAFFALFGGLSGALELISKGGSALFGWMVLGFILCCFYYAVPEAIYGTTLGKTALGLRVFGPNQSLPGFKRALIRVAIYLLVPQLPFWGIHISILLSAAQSPILLGTTAQVLLGLSYYVILALLFLTARQQNGYRAVHDILSGTSVVLRPAPSDRNLWFQAPEPGLPSTANEWVGPYQILANLGGDWVLGYDLKLLRKVWILRTQPGSPAYPKELRDLSRATRLRWVTGHRSQDASWDAFEAPGGQAFLAVAGKTQPWETIRLWIRDLAQELSTAKRDGTMPEVLTLDQVWISSDGKPKLLPATAPGIQPSPVLDPSQFLTHVARTAVSGSAEGATEIRRPLPLHVREFLQALPALPSADLVLERLSPLLRRVARVTHRRRATMVFACAAFPLVVVCASFIGTAVIRQLEEQHPDLFQLNQILSVRRGMKWVPSEAQISDRDFAIYIDANHRAFITNTAAWQSPFATAMIQGEARQFAEQSVAEHAAKDPAEVARVRSKLRPPSTQDLDRDIGKLNLLQVVMLSSLIFYVAIPAIIAALAFRGGLVLLLARVTFVRADGSRASRLRLLWRALVTWSPVIVSTVLTMIAVSQKNPWIGLAGLLGLCALTVISVTLPDRGIQDRLAGTWPVPK